MLHILYGTDWTANRDEILRRVSRDVARGLGNRIVLVPELVSHDMERRLCASAGDTASRYAEVLSFTRLPRRVSEELNCAIQPCMDNGGRVVAMASTARQLTSRLKAYASVETRPEFLTGLLDAVDEFKRCCISAEDLMQASRETEGSLAQKLEELSILLDGYDSLCAQGKRDPRDQMTWLLERMEEGDFGRNYTFYIDGFPDYTRQHLAILEHLIRVCPDVTVSVNCDREHSDQLSFEKASQTASQLIQCAKRAGIGVDTCVISGRANALAPMYDLLFQGSTPAGLCADRLRVFRGETAMEECQAAAERILRLVHAGCRYRDIAVVCCDLPGYQPLLKLTFSRCNIPLYLAGTEDILDKSVISTVLCGMNAALSGFDQREVLRYLRSMLSPLDPDTCDLVENYVIVWGIRGNKWLEEWQNHPEGLSGQWDDSSRQWLAKLNAARREAVEPLRKLRDAFRASENMAGQILAIHGFLHSIGLEPRLEELAEQMDAAGDNRSAQILSQLWEILVSAMEQLYDVLGTTVWDADTFARLFRLLLSQYDVGTIPPVLDAVQAGQVSAMRCHQQKHLIVLGGKEGNLPGYSGSGGVLTDQERVALRNLGIPLTGGAMEGIQEEFAEIYGVFCGADETVSVYYSEGQPSFVTRRLAVLAGGETEAVHAFGAALSDGADAGAYLASFGAQQTAERLGVEQSYDETLRRSSFSLGKVEREHVEGLYGRALTLSASQIDRQAECRLSYFLKYGLRAAERKEAAVDPAEFGTYVHWVLENTARNVKDRGGFQQVSLEQTLQIADDYSKTYMSEHFSALDSQRLSYLFNRNVQELHMVVAELWEELQNSQFQPQGFEIGFGKEEGLAAIPIDGKTMDAVLRGYVDRVDTWNHAGNSYYRVVDYKTGRKDFDYCDVFSGVGLQMLLYLFALEQCGQSVVGDRPIPAGVQYFPARMPYRSEDGRLSEEEAAQKRRSDLKRKGLLLNDSEILQAMEAGEKPVRMSYKIMKDGTLSGDLASREQLRQLKAHIYTTLGNIVDEIASGNVEPNPYTRGSEHSACDYCPYGAICHPQSVPGRRNYKTMKADRFWQEIEKEVTGRG